MTVVLLNYLNFSWCMLVSTHDQLFKFFYSLYNFQNINPYINKTIPFSSIVFLSESSVVLPFAFSYHLDIPESKKKTKVTSICTFFLIEIKIKTDKQVNIVNNF